MELLCVEASFAESFWICRGRSFPAAKEGQDLQTSSLHPDFSSLDLSFLQTFDENACLSDSPSRKHRFSLIYHFRSFACLTFCLLSSAGDCRLPSTSIVTSFHILVETSKLPTRFYHFRNLERLDV